MATDNRKVVINKCYGGFGLSTEALHLLEALKKQKVDEFEIERDDPDLVRVVEELTKKANGEFSNLKIVQIPVDVQWEIKDYDGIEWVAEKHRTWG